MSGRFTRVREPLASSEGPEVKNRVVSHLLEHGGNGADVTQKLRPHHA